VQEQLSQIDTACVDALKALKDEQDVLDGRVKAMDEMKGNVAEAVYLRVRSDYVAKRDALEAEARPQRDKARGEYTRLQAILSELETATEAINLDRQELELRHQLGEFDKKEYEHRLKAIDTSAAEKAELNNQASALRERFLAAVRAESELLLPAPPAAKAAAPRPQPAATTEEIPKAAVAAAAEAAHITAEIPALPATPAPAPAAIEGTMVMPAIPPKAAAKAAAAPAPAPAAPIVSEATVMFRPARLVPQNPEAGKATHALTLKPLAIGSDQANDVRIGGPGVEPKHAMINPTPKGYVITDLDTKHGTRVNNEKVKEKLLGNEDIVQVGAARFVFRAS
jgi:hypothetical protein